MYRLNLSKKLKIVLISSVILLFSTATSGITEEIKDNVKQVTTKSICFNEQDAYKITGIVENYDNLVKSNAQLIIQNNELKEQTKIYREQLSLFAQKIQKLQEYSVEQEKMYQAHIAEIEKLHQLKEEALEKDLKEASKPRWGAMISSYGLGAITVALLLVL